jgi:hypothetical protein
MQFKKDNIVVRDDSTCPEGALVVDGFAPSGDMLAHPLGGGLQLILPAADLPRFAFASELERTPLFHRALFEVEGVDAQFAGWSDGRVWNGWSMPHFEFSEAEKIIAAMTPENGHYNPVLDAFVTGTNDEAESWPGEIIGLADGGAGQMYAVGAGSWIWDEIDQA